MHWMTRLRQRIESEIRFIQALRQDPRVPASSRWLLLAALVYACSPIDLIPDFIPVVGYLDDLLIVPLLVGLALRAIPTEAVQQARAIGTPTPLPPDPSESRSEGPL